MYKHGDYNVICDASGFKVKASECRMQWDGLFVKKEFWEARHPQDFVKAVKDRQRVPIARDEQAYVFMTDGDVTPESL